MHGEDFYASEIILFRMPVVFPLRNAERLKTFLLRLGSIGGIQVFQMIFFLMKLGVLDKSFLLFIKTPNHILVRTLSIFVTPVETWFHIVAMYYEHIARSCGSACV